jgi:cytochrome P450/NADPH-cytochrome P450 reductase
MNNLVPIPEPRGLPFLGNIGEFTTSPMNDLLRLADTYGSIYRIRLGGKSLILVSSNALVNEICDEKRFHKTLKTVLGVVREGVHDGLFTVSVPQPPNPYLREHIF